MMLHARPARDHARVQGLSVVLPPAKDEPDKPLWIEPPLDVTVKDFQLADATIYRQNEKLVTIRQVGLSARWKTHELIVESLAVHPGDIKGDLVVSGRIIPDEGTVHAALKARWKDVVVQENLAGRVLASRGEIEFQGTPKPIYQGRARRGPPSELVHAVIDASGTDARAELRPRVAAERAAGAAGTVESSPWRGPLMQRRAISILA
jgi:hypothetical protein